MPKDCVCERTFTALPGLQEAHLMRYTLMQVPAEEAIYYSIRVTEVYENQTMEDEIGPFTASLRCAKTILQYLYENAVCAAHCISIISDAVCILDSEEWEDVCVPCTHSVADCR